MHLFWLLWHSQQSGIWQYATLYIFCHMTTFLECYESTGKQTYWNWNDMKIWITINIKLYNVALGTYWFIFYQRVLDRGWDRSTSLLIPYICNLPYRLPRYTATKSKLYLPCCTGIRNMCFDGHKGINEATN